MFIAEQINTPDQSNFVILSEAKDLIFTHT
jgi:hypothetical protein